MTGDRVLSEDRLRGVLDLFERLRERPPRRRRQRLRPLLMLLGPADHTSHVAGLFQKRCEAERAPVSHIAADTLATDVSGVLREAKRELSQPSSHPRGEPSPRFPLLEMALWLRDLREIRLAGDGRPPPQGASPAERENHQLVRRVTHPPVGDNENARRRELNRVIRRRGRDVLRDLEDGPRGRAATFLAFLEQIAPIGVAVVALVSAGTAAAVDLVWAVFAAVIGLAFVTVQILARTRGWYGVRRFGWFLRQPYLGRDSTGFLGFALGVFDARPVEADDHREQLDLLLIAAFLEDLRRNYHRDVRRAAWARVRHPVLIFEHVTAGHVGVRFLELLERVRRDNQDESGLPDVDPLVVTVGVDPAAPAGDGPSAPPGARLVDRLAREFRVDLSQGAAENAVAARGLWDRYRREQARVSALGARRELRVDITRDPGGDLPPVRAGRGRPWLAHPALPWIAMIVVAASSVTAVSVASLRYCSAFQIRRTGSGECVGITDGSFRFDEAGAGEHGPNRLSPVLARLKDQNDAVARSGKPHATIVYIGPVTADPAIKNRQLDLLAGAQGELLGLAMAQAEFNGGSQNLRLRVLVANAGAKFQHGHEIAERIRRLALKDRSIVAVVGFEQSRLETQDAIKVLSKSALPMVGTANSYNGTGLLDRGAGYSPYYFRLAPPNSRLAQHAAYWAREGRVGGRPGRTVDVIYSADSHDLYSADLAESFAREFGRGDVLVRKYDSPGDLDRTVHELCQKPPDLFYYAGRSDEFRSFAYVLQHTCPSGQVILADDEIAKYVADNAPEIGHVATFRLYYMPLAAREAWTPPWVGSARNVFFNSYPGAVESMFGKSPSRDHRPSEVRAAVSYDAASMIAYVANQVFTEQAAAPTAGGVFAALDDPGKGALWKGASGVLRFTGRAQGHQVIDKPVLLATVGADGRVHVEEVCGTLVQTGQARGHCPPGAWGRLK